MKNGTIFILALPFMIVPLITASTTYGFDVYNVNLNRTVDLPIKPLYNKTTIQPGYPSCGTDAFTTINNTQKEKAQNPEMFTSSR